MEEQKIRALKNWRHGITPIQKGDIYLLTDEGVMINGHLWKKFLENSGDTLFEKWTNYWLNDGMPFELVEDGTTKSTNSIKQNIVSVEFESDDDLYLELNVKDKNAITNFEYLDESQIDTAIELLQNAKEYLGKES